MKTRFIFILIVIFFAGSSENLYSQDKEEFEHGYYVEVGDPAPDFIIKESEGKEYRLSDLHGKVVMLQFTASWCVVCRREMPFIEDEIWNKGKGNGLVVIGIDRDEPVETVKKFKTDIAVTYPLALDPGADIFGLFANKKAGVTRNIIIDRDGKIIFLTRLFEREEFDQMKEVIFKELAKK